MATPENPDKDAYISSLQEEIERHKKDKDALRGELRTTGADGVGTNASNAGAVKEALVPRVPDYIARIDALAIAADSESVRLAANKLLVEWAITGRLDASNNDADGEFKDLLKRLGTKKVDRIVDPNLKAAAERRTKDKEDE